RLRLARRRHRRRHADRSSAGTRVGPEAGVARAARRAGDRVRRLRLERRGAPPARAGDRGRTREGGGARDGSPRAERRSSAPLRVLVQRAVRPSWLPETAVIRRWASAAVGAGRSGEITIRIVGEAESAELNERYRGRTGPTNVRSFPAEIDGPLPDG